LSVKMLVDEIIESLAEEAKYHKAKEVIVGLRQTLVILDDGRAGINMTLRGNYSQIPSSALELLQLAKSPNPLLASVGCATINAFLSKNGEDFAGNEEIELMDIRTTDRVAIIGNMTPLIPQVQSRAKEVIVFEDNQLIASKETFPWWAEKLMLPDCDAVLVTGVAFTNKSVDEILSWTKKARFRAMIGPSTPVSPNITRAGRFDLVGGTRITNTKIAKAVIKSGGGIRDLKGFTKKTVLVRSRQKLSAIILAAGAGNRIGGIPKALLTLQDKTFLEITVQKIKNAGVNDILVVVGADAEKILPLCRELRVRAVVNDNWQAGMLSSIITGLEALPQDIDAIFLVPVDFPLVKPETYSAILEAWKKERRGIISPVYNGKLGHPVLISSGYFDEIKSAPREAGARAVIHSYEGKKDLILIQLDDPGTREDVDTEEQYEKLLAKLRAQNKKSKKK